MQATKAEFESELATTLAQISSEDDDLDECLQERLDAVHPGVILAFMQERLIAPEFDEYVTSSIQCFPDYVSLWPILYAHGDPWDFTDGT